MASFQKCQNLVSFPGPAGCQWFGLVCSGLVGRGEESGTNLETSLGEGGGEGIRTVEIRLLGH